MSWLISPRFDIRSLKNPVLAFRTSVRYPDKSFLEVFVSSNWSGVVEEISQATWISLATQIAQKTDDPSHWVIRGCLCWQIMLPIVISRFVIRVAERHRTMEPTNSMIYGYWKKIMANKSLFKSSYRLSHWKKYFRDQLVFGGVFRAVVHHL